MVDKVGIVSCTICCIFHVHSPLGDEISIGMCPKTSVTMCIIQVYDCKYIIWYYHPEGLEIPCHIGHEYLYLRYSVTLTSGAPDELFY